MALNLSRRNMVLGGVLLATLAISAWTLLSGSDENVVEPVARSGKGPVPGARTAGATRKPAADASAADLTLAERPAAPAKVPNLFAAYTYQPPAAAPVAQAAVKPHAPALPFTYTGHLEIEGVSTYLMMQGDMPLSVTLGSALGDFTLVEATSDHLVFQHGPTGDRVAMPIGAAK